MLLNHKNALDLHLGKMLESFKIRKALFNKRSIFLISHTSFMKQIIIVLMLVSTLAQLSCDKQDEDVIPEFSLDQADQLESDEYDVYSVILESYDISQFIIRQQTSVYITPKENHELFFNLDSMAYMEATLYERYAEANNQTYFLEEKIAVPFKNVKLLADKEYDYYFDREDLNKGWELFGKKYPEAGRWFFRLNKIGFNESRTQAIVGSEAYWYQENPDGPTLSHGRLIYLEKKNDVWEQVGSTSYRF